MKSMKKVSIESICAPSPKPPSKGDTDFCFQKMITSKPYNTYAFNFI